MFLLSHFLCFCLLEHPEVIILLENRKLGLQTTRTWDYLGQFSTPTSSKGLLHETNMGSGAIIGVIDSGIISVSLLICFVLNFF